MLHEISLLGIAERGNHGVFPEERRDGQPFTVDLRYRVEIDPSSAASDKLASTADYAQLIDLVRNRIATEPVNLIETLARDLLATLLRAYPAILWAEVTVHKPKAPVAPTISDIRVTVSGTRAEVVNEH